MANNRRTTVSAPRDALATLEAEAERRGVALTAVLAEAIVEKATALRQKRRPRLGTGSSGGRSPGARILTAEPIADELKVATLDHRHFAAVRPAHVPALHLLPD